MKKLLFAVLVCASLSAYAQKATPWQKEPTAVFGIALGEVLDNAAIGECGGAKPQSTEESIAACTMHRPRDGDLVIAGLPVSVFDGGFVRREDGVVTSISLRGKQGDYQSIKTLLLERYGRPTVVRTEALQNAMGATFKSEVLTWYGKKVSLILEERSDSIDTTRAFFSHNATATKRLLEREKSLKESASKM